MRPLLDSEALKGIAAGAVNGSVLGADVECEIESIKLLHGLPSTGRHETRSSVRFVGMEPAPVPVLDSGLAVGVTSGEPVRSKITKTWQPRTGLGDSQSSAMFLGAEAAPGAATGITAGSALAGSTAKACDTQKTKTRDSPCTCRGDAWSSNMLMNSGSLPRAVAESALDPTSAGHDMSIQKKVHDHHWPGFVAWSGGRCLLGLLLAECLPEQL